MTWPTQFGELPLDDTKRQIEGRRLSVLSTAAALLMFPLAFVSNWFGSLIPIGIGTGCLIVVCFLIMIWKRARV
jgi:hypothetical protein